LLSKINHPLVDIGHWQEIAKGSSNTLFRTTIEGENYVLRVNASDEFAFGVNRVREAQILSLIATQNWAPKVIENAPQAGWCLMRNHGASVTANVETKKAVLQWMKELQLFSQKLKKESKNYDEFEKGRREQNKALEITPAYLSSLYFDYQQLFDKYKSLFKKSTGKRLALQLCDHLDCAIKQLPIVKSGIIHQDLHLGNVLQSQDTGLITVIDWEYGGWGQPWLDTAALLTEFELDKAQLKALPVFEKMDVSEFEEALSVAVIINQGLACIWYWLRSELEDNNQVDNPFDDKAALAYQAEQLIDQLATF
jgi:thiamine kinase